MKIDEKLLSIGHPNRSGQKLKGLKALVVHYTGNDHPGATDTANINYMGRKYIVKDGVTYEADGVTKFRLGSAHCFIDNDSATLGVPFSEVCWACGDRPLPRDNGFGGQTRLAKEVFKNMQNYYTVSFELCNNKDWDIVIDNGISVIRDFIKERNLKVITDTNKELKENEVYILRHFDITSKKCPVPLLDEALWKKFVDRVVV